MTLKVGLFGGAFNPPHYGHLQPVHDAMRALGLQRVVFIPSGVHPFKGEDRLAPVEDRLAMIRLATASQPEFSVWDVELLRRGVSYTLDTVIEWHRQFPGEEPVLLIGSDILSELHLWKGWRRLIDHAHICLLTRPGFASVEWTAPAMEHLRGLQVFDAEALDYQRLGRYGFLVQSVTLLDISSTELRRRWCCGESLHALTPSAVIDYLQTHDFVWSGS